MRHHLTNLTLDYRGIYKHSCCFPASAFQMVRFGALTFFVCIVVQSVFSRQLSGAAYPFWVVSVANGGRDCDAVTAAIEEVMREFFALSSSRHLDENREAEALSGPLDCFVAIEAPPELAALIEQSVPEVLEVAPDEVMTVTKAPPWGLDRLDQPGLPLSRTAYAPVFDGKGSVVYVIDTGVFVGHGEFAGGRARAGADFINESGGNADMNGHGSHCAGIVGGGTLGVAPGASLVGVKVLCAGGSGSTAGVIRGLQWAESDSRGFAAVMSVSIGGNTNAALNRAFANVAKENIVVVAAGNSNSDACRFSPAGAGGQGRSGGVISVGSTTSNDSRSSFSNHGACVDIWAPGSAILSVGIKSPTDQAVMSGTSMACPAVAGVAAVLLQKHAGDRMAAVSELFAIAAGGRVADAKETANILVQVPTYTGPPTSPTTSPTGPPTAGPLALCGTAGCVLYTQSTFGPDAPNTIIGGPIVYVKGFLGCSPVQGKPYAGAILMVDRGNCLFYDKVMNAQRGGAVAVVIRNTGERPFAPGYYGDGETPAIPSCMVGNKADLSAGEQVTWGRDKYAKAPIPSPKTPVAAPTRRGWKPRCRKKKKQAQCEVPWCRWTGSKCKGV